MKNYNMEIMGKQALVMDLEEIQSLKTLMGKEAVYIAVKGQKYLTINSGKYGVNGTKKDTVLDCTTGQVHYVEYREMGYHGVKLTSFEPVML